MSGPAAPAPPGGAPAPGPSPSPAPALPDEDMLRALVCGMLSQDPEHLRSTVAAFYAPGAVLYHYLTRAATALDIYRVSYAASFTSRPVVRDIIIDSRLRNPFPGAAPHRHALGAQVLGVTTGPGAAAMKDPDSFLHNKEGAGGQAEGKQGREAAEPPAPPPGCTSACVWLDQHVTPKRWWLPVPFLPLPEGVIPTLVLLKFRPDPETGRPLVYEQYDHISLYAFTWSFGGVSRWLFDAVMAPAVMWWMGAVAWALDFGEECGRFAGDQVFTIFKSRAEGRSGGGEGAAAWGTPVGGGAGQGVASPAPTACPAEAGACPPGAGGGSGGACGQPLRGRHGEVRWQELPGEVNHTATGYGLEGTAMDGSDMAAPLPAIAAAVEGAVTPGGGGGSGGASSGHNVKPLPPIALR
ncbi:hypothetical protein HYH03_012742 [Edaphochlamys debaryana]|uniref:Uncharacterized protein n=1 Tax=Edaphochlamys debaryana TaxID=47281 RepID=A0A835XS52_9CHLO|nr:hypothetical protein HYH03_012742 [Edaphochlamys debaryana]|eukprot:KAG2488744.1 hypothetical protein HYH03_012742 [Edaphochlamys debaryana]